MKLFIQFNVVLSILLFSVSPVYSEGIDQLIGGEARKPLATPSEVCFRQSNLIGDLENMTLQHYLMVMPEDVGKPGRVFVGARLRSQPGVTWLTNGGDLWVDDRGNDAIPYPLNYGGSTLQAIIPITVFHKPINLAGFVEEGEIWIGYGLWPESGPDNYDELARAGRLAEIMAWRQRTAYEEMLVSGRYKKVWTVGEHTEANEICTIVTELIERKDFTVGLPVCPDLGCLGEDLPVLD